MSKNNKSENTATKRVEKNGVVQPREGGKTRKVWDICASLRKSLGRVPTRAEVLAEAKKIRSNPNMAATQYGYWRRFEGIEGRVSAPKPAAPKSAKPAKSAKKPAKPAAPKAPAKPAAPKAPSAPKPPAPPAAAPAPAAS